MALQKISATMPYASRYVDVFGSHMHYIDEGEGEVFLFVHGNPSSSYLWRNVLPHVVQHGRCIALDLIGMGKSDTPGDLDYTFMTQAKYLAGFIDALELKNVHLVLHDWGGALGFYYAMRHQENVRSIAFMEVLMFSEPWSEFPGTVTRQLFRLFRSSKAVNWLLLGVCNVLIRAVYAPFISRKLSTEEKRAWASPFPTIASRAAIRRWPTQIPLDKSPVEVHEAFEFFKRELQDSDIPKLLLYVTPGVNMQSRKVEWCRENLPNIQTVHIDIEGGGKHFIQEDNPRDIGRSLAQWAISQTGK